MKLQKRSFLLLEILIALTLLSFLLSCLFNAMAQGIKVEVTIGESRKTLLARQHLQTRLQDLFLSIAPTNLPPIYTQVFPQEKKESLMIHFDNGIDPNPSFSGPILGRIYLDEEHNLALALWPIGKENKNKPWRKEILLKGVSQFQFQFLGQKQKKEDESINANLAWHKLWPKNRLEVPAMIRLSLYQNNVELQFAFFLTTAEPLITYFEEGYQS